MPILILYQMVLTDVSNDPNEIYLPEINRWNTFVFLQDEWQINSTIRLTTGIRWDHYSDFGDTVNPRLALNWSPKNDWNMKWLYGKAFRAPAIAELYTQGNPVVIGNPELKAETLKSYEWSLGKSTELYSFNLTLYRFDTDNGIIFVNDPNLPTNIAKNVVHSKGKGFELEGKFLFRSEWVLHGNISYSKVTDIDHDHDAGSYPRFLGYIQFDSPQFKQFSFQYRSYFVGKQYRSWTDPRPPVSSYLDSQLTLKWKTNSWIVDFRITNIFDQKYYEPSVPPDLGAAFINIPNDLPQAGRSFSISLIKRY